ncbi:lycopene cyclase family protein [Flavobacteriaceae bacterium]|nr:lycopene cyclase family protein [Flavobacteriaceae bacterium]
MELDYDYIICGGGISGLLLALKFSNDSYYKDKSILILDPDFPKKSNDRTLCFWDKKNSIWDSLLTSSWENVVFKNGKDEKSLDLNPLNYKMLSSISFYDYTNSIIKNNTNIQVLNEKVLNFKDYKSHCLVQTKENTFKSSKVFNSILDWNIIKKDTKYPLLIQHFEGWVIKTKHDSFDSEKATFMDFSIPQDSTTKFMYILPFSKNEALVEFTLFSQQVLNKEDYHLTLSNYLESSEITDYEIISKETGQIPMTCYPFFESNTKNILNIGSAGGWSKPSTGYTFKNIDRNTTKIIEFLKTENNFKKFLKKNRFWFYDLIFLDVLYYKNHLGKQLFTNMFKKNDPKTIFKFLDNKSSFIEELKIMLSFPKTIFLSAVLKRIYKGL